MTGANPYMFVLKWQGISKVPAWLNPIVRLCQIGGGKLKTKRTHSWPSPITSPPPPFITLGLVQWFREAGTFNRVLVRYLSVTWAGISTCPRWKYSTLMWNPWLQELGGGHREQAVKLLQLLGQQAGQQSPDEKHTILKNILLFP